jgi:hypothetical protein
VWIESRNEAIPVVAQDAVPIVVQNVATTAVMPVRLAGASPGSPPAPVAARQTSQPWEYRTIAVPGDVTAQGLTNLLTGPGNEGWEPAGAQVMSGGTLLVLKRSRP